MTNVVDGAIVEEVSGDNLLNDLVQDFLLELGKGNLLSMLSGDDNGIDTKGDSGSAILLVLDGNLGLGIWADPREETRATSSSQGGVELVGENDGERHILLRLVGGIAEHDSLVTGTVGLEVTMVETLGNVGRLLLDGDEDVAGLVVEALFRRVVADLLDGVTDDLLEVEVGLGGDLTENHDHARLGGRLAADLGPWVLRQTGVELCKQNGLIVDFTRWRGRRTHDGIGDLVTDLVCNESKFYYTLTTFFKAIPGCPSPTDSEVKRKWPGARAARTAWPLPDILRLGGEEGGKI